MPVIKLRTKISADRQIVFDLSRSIDLHKVSTAHTNEEAIAGKTSGLIGAGESVTWRAKHFGVYQTLTSKITEFNSPDLFVDEMVEGAFKRFRHEHRFESNGSSTEMIDVFDYSSPFGILGRLADKLFLENYMKGLLEKRNDTIKEFAESDKWKTVVNENSSEMNLEELDKRLKDYGIVEAQYYLHGLYGSTNDDDKLSLRIRRGLSTTEYEVYYSERGAKLSSRIFTAEHDACQHILDRLRESTIIIKVSKVESLEGMTVNERLHATGLMDEFDIAKTHEPEHAKRILRLLKIDKQSINKIVH